MNPFHLRIEKFDYSLPAGRVIAAVQLQEMAQSRDILSAAREQAAKIVQAAQDESRVLLAQAQQQADMLMVQARNQTEAEVLAQHVGWLVAAEQLEAALITQSRQHILAAITAVVTAWAGQQSVEQILIHRLGAQVEQMAHGEKLVLQVHPQHLPAVTSALGERVQCVGDESMPEDAACLGSPMLQVSLSLRSHLAQLILWLQESAHD